MLFALFDASEDVIQKVRVLVVGKEINDYDPSTDLKLEIVKKHYGIQDRELETGNPGEALVDAIVSRIATQHI